MQRTNSFLQRRVNVYTICPCTRPVSGVTFRRPLFHYERGASLHLNCQHFVKNILLVVLYISLIYISFDINYIQRDQRIYSTIQERIFYLGPLVLVVFQRASSQTAHSESRSESFEIITRTGR